MPALLGFHFDTHRIYLELSCNNEDDLVAARDWKCVQNARHGFVLAEGLMGPDLVGMIGLDRREVTLRAMYMYRLADRCLNKLIQYQDKKMQQPPFA